MRYIGMTCEVHAQRAQAIGTELKSCYNISSAYYVLYTGIQDDAVLNWVSEKMDELYPNLTKGNAYISVPGVCFYLHDHSVFKVVPDYSLVKVHKKRFKRYLKKAICANRTQC